MKIVAFVPIKLNNERLPDKNILSFENGKPLVRYILETALKVSNIDDIYCFCSKDKIKDYIPEEVKFVKREEWLDSNTATATDFVCEFAKQIEADIYVLLHCTAPFLSADTIYSGVEAIKGNEYDSALSVCKHNDFLWTDNEPNYDLTNIPRTQDLKPFYTETNGMYAFKREVVSKKRRIGDSPYLIEVDSIEAIDIDEKIDFEIAEAIFNTIILKRRDDNPSRAGGGVTLLLVAELLHLPERGVA